MTEFIPAYDLESLNETQRQDYVKRVCRHMGVPDDLNLVMLTYLDEQDGPRRLVAYAKRGAAEIIRANKGINITDLRQEPVGGSIVWTVTAKDKDGRQEMSSGSKWINGLSGRELDDAIMTAQTRAVRRVTLQFVGAGVLDESEVNPMQTTVVKNTTPTAVPPQPVVAPPLAAGTDITGSVNEPKEIKKEDVTVGVREIPQEEQERFRKQQEELRKQAIESLNAEPVKKTRKPRKPKVDFGPSTTPVVFPAGTTTVTVPALPAPVVVTLPPVVNSPVPNPVTPVPNVGTPTGKPRLAPEVMKPFRQRQLKFITDLELSGFAPKEGTGNLDKMRSYVELMFPEVTNFNELTAEQWEKYLTSVETKISTQGAAATIKYIEETIGL